MKRWWALAADHQFHGGMSGRGVLMRWQWLIQHMKALRSWKLSDVIKLPCLRCSTSFCPFAVSYCIVNGWGCHDLESTWLGLQGRCKDFREIREGRRGGAVFPNKAVFTYFNDFVLAEAKFYIPASHWEATDVSPSTAKCGTLRESIPVPSIPLSLDPEA